MKNWIILTFLYAIFLSLFYTTKKKALEKNDVYEVLASFTLLAFIITAISSKNVLNVEFKYLTIIFLKSVLLSISWIIVTYVIGKISISLYSVINLSRIIFSVVLSIIILDEKLSLTMFFGLIIVMIGLILVNLISCKKDEKEASFRIIILFLFACFLSSICAIIDKKVLKNITSSQLQFWFMLFLTLIYWWILLIRNKKINFKNLKRNYWILGVATFLAVGDKFLFMANAIPESKVSVMTIIKQFNTIELIILGKIVFKEKHTFKKLLCSLLIIFGIILTIV